MSSTLGEELNCTFQFTVLRLILLNFGLWNMFLYEQSSSSDFFAYMEIILYKHTY